MTTFLTNPFFLNLFSNALSITTLIFKELLYIYKIRFSTIISKNVITYITLTVTIISKKKLNNITVK